MSSFLTRRRFLAASGVAIAGALVPTRAFAIGAAGRGGLGPHPTPRPGITGAKVATREQLAARPKLMGLFDAVRANAAVVDGIRCNCGCAAMEGFYSLLSCYEGLDAMAKECVICQGQGRLAVRLHKEGKSLDEIRSAVDAKFG